MKKKIPEKRFITVMHEAGFVNQCGIVHRWYTDKDVLVEWINFTDVQIYAMTGEEISPYANLVPENCYDINLDAIGDYKLHFSWWSALGEIVRTKELFDRYVRESDQRTGIALH